MDPALPSSDPPPLALVTGGARRIGRAIALALCQEGYAIGLHFNTSSEEVRQTAGEIRQLGREAYLIQGDLTDPEQIRGMFREIDRLPRRLGVLVNSASRMERADLLEISVERWDATLALNLRAPLLCAQEAARRMGEQGGAIINITDAGAHKVWTGYPAYTVSKAGLETLTRLLARTLAPRIRVNAVAPGMILPSEQAGVEEWERLVRQLPLKRAGSTEAIARAVVFLLQNEYITGQTLVIDGGYQLL
ncbi:MAG TPA: SDR family oxidoreductase [Anaerolineaceae bacterium]|nr:SDR family oxidoreductase [Anaerolineaceae bacterium]